MTYIDFKRKYCPTDHLLYGKKKIDSIIFNIRPDISTKDYMEIINLIENNSISVYALYSHLKDVVWN